MPCKSKQYTPFTVKTFSDLHFISRLVLRIRYDAKNALALLGKKFGCDPELEAPLLLNAAAKMGLQVIGISFHVGSGCDSMEFPIYAKAIYSAKKLFDYAETLSYNFSLLDIGGGFPGNKNSSIVEVCSFVAFWSVALTKLTF